MNASAWKATADPREVDLALRRHDIVFRYLASEHAMTLTRNQFFLAANAGLLAFGANRFPTDSQWSSLLLPAIVAIIGLVFSVLWILVLVKISIHLDRSKAVLLEIEPTAFGPHEVIRGIPMVGMRAVNKTIAGIAIVVVARLP